MEPSELAARIAEHRIRAGMRQQDLALASGLDRTALAKIESGQRRVSALELDALAAALDIGIGWFFEAAPASLVAYRTTLDPEAPTSSIDRLIERLARDADFVENASTATWPALRESPGGLSTRSDAERLAAEARGWMGIGDDDPITGLGEAAFRAGALIFSVDLGPDSPEAASVVSSQLGIGVVNGHLRVGRRRLAAAHELGHLITRDGYRVDWRIDAPGQQERETRLDQFARALLLPSNAVRTAWATSYDGGRREAAIRMASVFQVDMATLATRLVDLGLATTAEAAQLRVLQTTKADIVGYDLVVRQDLEPPSAPRAYQQAVLQLHAAEDISSSRAVDLLVGTFDESDLPPRPLLPEDAAWGLLRRRATMLGRDASSSTRAR